MEKRQPSFVSSALILMCVSLMEMPLIQAVCNLRTFELGDTMHVLSTVNCARFRRSDCEDFVLSWDQSLLPTSVQGSVPVGKPSNVTIQPFLNPYRDNAYPGFHFTWEYPLDDSYTQTLKGFLLIYYINGNLERCYLFPINPENEKITFSKPMWYVRPNQRHTIKIYSLPPPSADMHESSLVFEEATMWAGNTLTQYTSSAVYAHNLAVIPKSNGIIEVAFNRSPPRFGITTFKIKLLKRSYSDADNFREILVNVAVATDKHKWATFQLANFANDEYKIGVVPIDHSFGEQGACQCWQQYNIQRLCMGCAQVESDWITVPGDPNLLAASVASHECYRTSGFLFYGTVVVAASIVYVWGFASL